MTRTCSVPATLPRGAFSELRPPLRNVARFCQIPTQQLRHPQPGVRVPPMGRDRPSEERKGVADAKGVQGGTTGADVRDIMTRSCLEGVGS